MATKKIIQINRSALVDLKIPQDAVPKLYDSLLDNKIVKTN